MNSSPPPPAVTVRRVGQIAVRADDVAASMAFYRDQLGLRHLFTVSERMAFMDCGGVRLMLSPAEQPESAPPSSIVYYAVDDLGAAHTALQARNVPCESAPHLIARMADSELWMAFYRDPAQNIFGLMQEKR